MNNSMFFLLLLFWANFFSRFFIWKFFPFVLNVFHGIKAFIKDLKGHKAPKRPLVLKKFSFCPRVFIFLLFFFSLLKSLLFKKDSVGSFSFNTTAPIIFTWENYSIEAIKMKKYLHAIDLWEVVEVRGDPPELRQTNPTIA